MCNPFSAPDAVCANDRAFMPNPATESDGATRGQMQALIATAPTNVLAAIGGRRSADTGQATTKPYWPLFWEQAERPIITPQQRAAQTQQTARG